MRQHQEQYLKKKLETVPLPTFAEVLESTTRDKTDFSILPVENSLEGSVGESYDLLYNTTLNAIGEFYLKIEHCLIGDGKVRMRLDVVYSHPQALGQCRKFIEKHGMKTVPTYDTAGSVKIIKDIAKNNVACIASKMASEIYNMPIIAKGIADNLNNYTTIFIVIKTAKKRDRKRQDINYFFNKT